MSHGDGITYRALREHKHRSPPAPPCSLNARRMGQMESIVRESVGQSVSLPGDNGPRRRSGEAEKRRRKGEASRKVYAQRTRSSGGKLTLLSCLPEAGCAAAVLARRWCIHRAALRVRHAGSLRGRAGGGGGLVSRFLLAPFASLFVSFEARLKRIFSGYSAGLRGRAAHQLHLRCLVKGRLGF
jgi:hypothetical protein